MTQDCGDHILYLEGFDVSEILGGEPGDDFSKNKTGKNIKKLSSYIANEDTQNNYSTQFEVPNLLDDTREFELNVAEEAKKAAVYTFEKDVEEDGKTKKKYYIKEGAVIGKTFSSDPDENGGITEETKVEIIDTKAEKKKQEAEENGAKSDKKDKKDKKDKNDKNDDNKNKKNNNDNKNENENDQNSSQDEENNGPETKKKKFALGNYMKMILRDTKDEVVENVEDFVETGEGGGASKGIDTEFPEEFLYWEATYVEGGIVREGDYYKRDDVPGDGKMTTAFGLTEDCQGTAEKLGYNNYRTCLENDQIPVQMAQDIFIGEMEADREAVLNKVSKDKLSEAGLDALVSIYHNSPQRSMNLMNKLNSSGQLTEQNFIDEWGSIARYEASLKNRRRGEFLLYNQEKYPDYKGSEPFKIADFKTETPWTDFCNGKSESEIMTWSSQ